MSRTDPGCDPARVARAGSEYLRAGKPGSMGTVCATILLETLADDLRRADGIRMKFSRRQLLEAMRAHRDWGGKEFEETSFNSIPEEIGRRLRDFVFRDSDGTLLRFLGPTRRFRAVEKSDPDLFLEVVEEPLPARNDKPRAGVRRAFPRTAFGAVLVAATFIVIVVADRPRSIGKSPVEAAKPTELRWERVTSTPSPLVDLSPDGRFLAYVTEHRQLRLKQISTHSEITLFTQREGRMGRPTFSPDQEAIYMTILPQEATSAELWRIPIVGGVPEKILDGLTAINLGVKIRFSPDGSRFLFVRDGPGGKGSLLCSAAPDGSEVRVLASLNRDPRHSYVPTMPNESFGGSSWHPDGKTVLTAVVSTMSGRVPKRLLQIDTQTGSMRDFTASVELTHASFLPSGRAFVGVSAGQIYLLSYPEGKGVRITRDSGSYSVGDISRDGARVLVSRRDLESNLWAVDPHSGEAKRLTSGSNRGDGIRGVSVAHTGEIYFSRTDQERSRYWVTSRDGRMERPVTNDSYRVESVSVVPDGDHLAIVQSELRDDRVEQDLWIVDTNGVRQRRITREGDVLSAAVSPDGQLVYYSRGVEGDVWVVPAAGGLPRRFFDARCFAIRLSPDGRSMACGGPKDSLATQRPDDYPHITSVSILSTADGALVSRFTRRSRAFAWHPRGDAVVLAERVRGADNLFLQPIHGGDAVPITRFTEGRIGAFDWTGQALVITRSFDRFEVMILSGIDEGLLDRQ